MPSLARLRLRRRRRFSYAIVSRELWPFHVGGGIGRSVNAQAGLLDRIADVTVVSSSIHRPLHERMLAEGDERLPAGRLVLVEEPSIPPGDPAVWPDWSGRVRDALAGLDGGVPDIVEFSDYLGEGWASVSARADGDQAFRSTLLAVRERASHEIVRTLDGTPPSAQSEAIERLERAAMAGADVLLAASRQVELDYRRFYAGASLAPARVLAPAFAPGPPAPAPDFGGPLRLLYVGRLQRFKGVHHLVEAVARLPDADLRLEVVGADTSTAPGGGSMRQHLEALAAGDRRIAFRGQVEHAGVTAAMADCHVLVVPSVWEAFANVAREALQRNRPVLATPVGGLLRIVTPGQGGWLTRAAGPDAIAEAIQRLLADRGEVERLIAGGLPAGSLAASADDRETLDGYRALARLAGSATGPGRPASEHGAATERASAR